VQSLVELREQAGTADHFRSQWRDIQFSGEKGVGMPASYPFCSLPCSFYLHEAPLLPGSYSSGWFDKIIIEDKRACVKNICWLC